MTDYTELSKSLRICTDPDIPCDECPYLKSCLIDHNDGVTGLMLKAADAIEELLRKEKFHEFLWNVINPNDMELYLTMYHSGGEKEKIE